MTKREMFETIATVNAENAEIVEFCKHEIELLNHKSTGKRGLTATQKANLEVKTVIETVLRDAKTALTVTEILKDARLAGYTNQKVSALLRQMPNVVKTIEGKKSFFSIA